MTMTDAEGRPSSLLTEYLRVGERALVVTWLPLPFRPPRALTTQAYGICFAGDGRIVLVSTDGVYWNLPGGHPEGDETLEEALRREVRGNGGGLRDRDRLCVCRLPAH